MKKHLLVLALVLATVFSVALIIGCGSDSSGKKAQSKYVYVANTEADTISLFTIDSTTGELTFVESVSVALGDQPTDLVKHPKKDILYASHACDWCGDSIISAWNINATGGLEEFADSPYVVTPGMALNLAITPSGEFLYTTDQDHYELISFIINSTGGLEVQAFSPTAAYEAHSIVMHPSGKFFYVGAEDTDIHGFAIDATGGYTGTPNTPYGGDDSIAYNWLSITPNGKYLYSVDAYGSGEIDGFLIDGTTGELTRIAGFPIVDAAGSSSKSSAITPDGKYFYLALWDTDEVMAYAINSDGTLTAVPNMPINSGGERPKSVTVDARGNYLYVANYGTDNVGAFSINSTTGELTAIDNYASGVGPKRVITVP